MRDIRTHLIMTAVVCIAAMTAFAIVSFAAELSPQEQKLIPLAKQEGAVTLINPLFSDRTAKRLGEAFIKRYGLGDDFKFNNIRKGTGATVATVRQEIKANKFTIDVHLVSAPGFFAAGRSGAPFSSWTAPTGKTMLTWLKRPASITTTPMWWCHSLTPSSRSGISLAQAWKTLRSPPTPMWRSPS